MSVDIPVPGPGQPVQFTVTLNNIGTDPATGVIVNDKLPAELAIPAGMAAFTSTGTYSPDTGTWIVGDMAAGATAVLVLPAIVAAAAQPPCSANVADTSNSLDTQKSNNRAVAAVRKSANDRCVDLAVSGRGNLVPPCEKSRRLDLSVSVTNAGPDAASNVFVDLGQAPIIAPRLRFTNAGCTGTRCAIASIPAGSSVTLQALSSDFTNSTSQTLALNFAASSSDTDYATANNQATSSGVVPGLRYLRHRHRPAQRGRSRVLHRDRRLRLAARTARPGAARVPRSTPAAVRAWTRLHRLLLPPFATDRRSRRRPRLAATAGARDPHAGGTDRRASRRIARRRHAGARRNGRSTGAAAPSGVDIEFRLPSIY